MIKDSGERRKFESGAVRDIQEGKGRCDLLPLVEVYMILQDRDRAYQFGQGAVLMNLAEAELSIQKERRSSETIRLIADAAGAFIISIGRNKYDAILEIAKHFEEGATKYGERNWEKGIPWHCYFDSGIRHYPKHMAGHKDERHDRAFLWNMICLMWTIRNRPDLNDMK